MSLERRLQRALEPRYRLESEIGRGGMAVVYGAVDLTLDRPVAVKVLSPELATAAEAERFLREARTLANLSHTHVVAVHDVGQSEGLFYFVMDRVRGETLARRLERGPLTPAETRQVGLGLLDALAAVHAAAVVHRDVKPANVFLVGGRPLLADFGVARQDDPDQERLTRAGERRGTLEYMAPEVLRGSPATPRSDLYSAGAVLYECATGRAWSDADYPRLTGVPPWLAAPLRKALAPDPADRFADAESFAAALKVPRGRRWVAPALAGVAVALAAVAWFATRPPAAGEPVTVLVAPLVDRSGDQALGEIADGLTDQITTTVGATASIRPVGRFTAMALKGQDLDVVRLGREFDVDYVAAGAVLRTGTELRVSLTLTDTREGLELWSRSFDYAADDFPPREDEMGRALLRALEVRVGGPASEPSPRGTTADLAAYEAYSRARRVWLQRQTGQLLAVALPGFQQAVEADPEWAQAWTGLADLYNVLGSYDYGAMDPAEAFPEATRAADRALRLDPGLPEALAAQASARFNAERDLEGAEARFLEAIERGPNYWPAHQWYSILLVVKGDTAAARARAQAASRLDPLSPVAATQVARIHYFAGRYDAAIAEYRMAIELDADFVPAWLGLGLSHLAAGQVEEALPEIQEGLRILGLPGPVAVAIHGYALARAGQTGQAQEALALLDAVEQQAFVGPEYRALIHLGLGQHDQAVELLERAADGGSNAALFYHLDPLLAPVRDHPRFQALVSRIGVAGAGP